MEKSRFHGFTLLEVLIALGIFAMSVLGLLGAINSELSAAREARVEESVLAQLQNRLAALQNEQLRPFERTVTIDSPQMTVTEGIIPRQVVAEDHTILTGYWTLSVQAEWTDDGTKRQEKISIIGYAP